MVVASVCIPRVSSCFQLPLALVGDSPRSVSFKLLLLSNDCFCPGTQSMWDFVCALQEWSLCSPQSPGSSGCETCWFSKPGVLGPRLAYAGPPGSLGRTSAMVITPICLLLPENRVLTLLCLCSSYSSHCGPLFVSLIAENLFSSSSDCSHR